ncbi:cysteine hydrolase [Paenibacillus glycanilyticus]|uniref:cysteine hydrolase family protein n=1 Tax=Paenibacillus glycanilyticus TaxID=126569 RepID=UPI00203DE1BC|nr:cysteine hydrolase family protein [Paenibacillus glycanilyticus]MCM3628505.1 cysteine hydrolase [Paenibacillus glycanilyticus]
MSKDTALMVIDVQKAMFEEAEPLHAADELIERINVLLAKARASQIPVIYVQHNEGEGAPLQTNTPGWEIHSAIAPAAQDLIIQKHEPDSFYETNLQRELEAKGIKRLVLSGLQTDYCINATARRAVELGYDVTVVKDAHSTYGQGSVSAEQIIEEHNQAFGSIAKTKETSAVDFS